MSGSEAAGHLLATALNVSPDEIGPETAIDNSPAWDSLAHFRVVAAIEAALDRQLRPDEIFSISDYSSVEALLSNVAV